MMVNWEDNVWEIFQSYNFYRKLKFFEEQNNPEWDLVWNFWSKEDKWEIDDFAEIMQVEK